MQYSVALHSVSLYGIGIQASIVKRSHGHDPVHVSTHTATREEHLCHMAIPK